MVLVHAFGSSGRAWAPQVAGLGGRYRAIAPDLLGHGVAAGPFTLDRGLITPSCPSCRPYVPDSAL